LIGNSSSGLVARISLPNLAFITNTYDNNGRMLGTWLYNSGLTNLDSSVYTNNVGNQRTSITRTGENTANYTYDPIGQVIADLASETTGATRWNEQLKYGFDPARNLNYRTNNALIQNFSVNADNELTTTMSGGSLTVVGTTTSTNIGVTVNGSNALSYADATFAATNMPLTTTYTAIAQDGYGRHATNIVTVNLATNVSFQYDANGNLISDGLRSFSYDDENQLIQVLVTNQWMSQFSYDGKMRRRIRQEFTWTNSAWVQTNAVYYVYDGNLAIQERDVNNLPTTTYTRGLDLSGSLTGAGGIGGLLARTAQSYVDTPLQGHAFYHADGNGNVTMLINSSQAVVAKYLYDAFGNLLSASGLLANANRYQFSSKEKDLNSGLMYYLYRFYDPNLQRWVNRDPIEEDGGINLYGFSENNPINICDLFGLNSQDVLLILSVYNQATTQMNQSGHRVGWFSPFSSLNSDIYYPWFGSGKGWECVRQSQYVTNVLSDQHYYDNWTIQTVTSPNLTHTWVQAVSSNPYDPSIILDPWWGSTTIYPSSPISNVNINAPPPITVTSP
jgi:RHS repeat-associated protein